MGKIYNPKDLINVVWPTGLNCYSFAAKCTNAGGAGNVACVPGARAGAPVTSATIDPRRLYEACVADGFEDVSGGVLSNAYKMQNPPAPRDGSYLVAVFYDTLHSFHFARQLADGSAKKLEWVHKPSAQIAPSNTQGNYSLGTDISNVPWGRFQFVAYLRAPNTGVTVNRGNF
jgi:hypothetical protein